MKRKRYILLDRDGTIIYNRHYLSDPEELEFLPGAAAGLRCMRDLGFGLVLITNQSGIGRGFFSEERLHEIHARFVELLRAEGVELDGIYYCPHAPESDCDCRKPRTGMVEQAARELGFDPSGSAMIGDSAADMGLARNLGIPGILIPGQDGSALDPPPTATVADLTEAAQWLSQNALEA